jgi:hypothetical protein
LARLNRGDVSDALTFPPSMVSIIVKAAAVVV